MIRRVRGFFTSASDTSVRTTGYGRLQNVTEVPEEAGTRPERPRAPGASPVEPTDSLGSVRVPSSPDRLSVSLNASRPSQRHRVDEYDRDVGGDAL